MAAFMDDIIDAVDMQQRNLTRNDLFVDVYPVHKFRISIPPSWSKTPRTTPTPTMEKFQEETVMLVGNSFVEGASLSVTRTQPVRLLKDFDIEWWFAPLNTLGDMGSPELIARLLVLQRQGEFEKKETRSEITQAVIAGNNLEFQFITPLAPEVSRKTLVRAIFTPRDEKFPAGKLDVVWVSALSGVFDSEYGQKLVALRDSFTLLRMDK